MQQTWDDHEPRCVPISSSETSSESEEANPPEPVRETPEEEETTISGPSETQAAGPGETASPEEIEEAAKKADEFKNEGNAHFKIGNYVEASLAYSNGLLVAPLKHPTTSVLYCNRAACFAHAEEHQKVIDDCTKAIDIDSTYSKAYFRRGTAHHKLKDYKSALADFKKVEELDPAPPRNLSQTITTLGPLAEKQQEEETAKMMGELKGLANKFLGLFNLSTDNFQVTPDGKGGQSIQFVQSK